MSYMQLINGKPEPIPYKGQFWIEGEGDTAIKHPKNNLRVKSFREDHNIVEIREQRYDQKLFTGTNPTLVEIEPGLWERQYTLVPRPQPSAEEIDAQKEEQAVAMLSTPVIEALIEEFTAVTRTPKKLEEIKASAKARLKGKL